MESLNIKEANIDKIGALFPNCITETTDENGKLKKAINFDTLRAILGMDIAEGDEAYEFKWVGKKAAIAEANKPIRKTLRPCADESVNWDSTENLYIEGDNLEVLKLLQESYLGKVKMIYIDPPYNTGNDFVYRDDFAMSRDEYSEESGQLDDEGNRLFKNTDSNGRFHSDWCSMIYSRLMLARNILADDGVIFISIDDNEQDSLKKICLEIFGESNFIGCIAVKGNPRGRQSSSYLAQVHDSLLVFRKTEKLVLTGFAISSDDIKKRFNKSDENGFYEEWELRKRGAGAKREDVPTLYYPIYYSSKNKKISTAKFEESDIVITPKLSDGTDGRWRWSKEKVEREKSKLYVRKTNKGIYNIYERKSLDEKPTQLAPTIWDYSDVNTELGTKLVRSLFDGEKYFDFPKPIGLIKRMIQIVGSTDGIILDFFSGSATTAHAVMQLNAEDGGRRKFIMVQLPEETEENSEAYKAGYKNICEIGKERIRRAGAKIKSETGADIDYGFRVLKLDDSNMKDVYYSPSEMQQQMLGGLESNIKPDRSDLDLLFGCLLDWGLSLTMPYSIEEKDGCCIHIYNDGDLVACFNEEVPESVIKYIADKNPLRVVFRDSCFKNSPEKINVAEIFKQKSPDSRIKII